MDFTLNLSTSTSEFVVGVNYNEVRGGSQTTIPEPISEMLGNPESLTFIVKDKSIMMSSK